MADLDTPVVPDWMRTVPGPALPTDRVKTASEDKIDHIEESSEEESDEEEVASVQEDAVGGLVAEEGTVAVQKPKPKIVQQLPTSSDYEDQTPFSVVAYPKRMSKEKDPSASATKKKDEEEKVGTERVLIIKGKQPMKILEETAPALVSNEALKEEVTGDPEKMEAPAPPAPVQLKIKAETNKKGKRVELAEPVQNNYARPSGKVAAKYSKVAAVKEKDAKDNESTSANTAATIAKLQTEQDAIIRKKKSKPNAVSASLARAVAQKRREGQHEQDRIAAEQRAAYEREHPEKFVHLPEPDDEADQDPSLPGASSPLTNPTRLQKAFRTMQKGEEERAVGKHRPEKAKEDREMMWRAVKWAGMAFVAFLVWVLHFA